MFHALQVFWDNFEAHRRSTLAVVAFPLGSWVGGMYTACSLHNLTLKGYRITTVTPGACVSCVYVTGGMRVHV